MDNFQKYLPDSGVVLKTGSGGIQMTGQTGFGIRSGYTRYGIHSRGTAPAPYPKPQHLAAVSGITGKHGSSHDQVDGGSGGAGGLEGHGGQVQHWPLHIAHAVGSSTVSDALMQCTNHFAPKFEVSLGGKRQKIGKNGPGAADGKKGSGGAGKKHITILKTYVSPWEQAMGNDPDLKATMSLHMQSPSSPTKLHSYKSFN
eukprot:g37953.t1